MTFSPGINCIFGGNGNGKTNLLEAVYFLAKKKSFRKNALFPQMISIDSDQLEIQLQAFLEHDAGEGTLSTKWDQYGQLWALDGRAVKRKPEIPCVFINPFEGSQFFLQTSVEGSPPQSIPGRVQI